MKYLRHMLCVITACLWLQPALATTTTITLPGSDHSISWPPELGKAYPDLVLINHKSETTRLADFKGKLLLIEPIGMSCAACNAFVGGHKKGGLSGIAPQADLKSIEEYFYQFTSGLSFDDPRIIHVQLLLYDLAMQPPGKEHAAVWAEHFGIDKKTESLRAGGWKRNDQQCELYHDPGIPARG